VIPERGHFDRLPTVAEIAASIESGDYSPETMLHALVRHHNRLERELDRITAMIEDPAEVELAMIRGDIAIPDRVEFDGIRTPVGYNPSPTDAQIDASQKDGKRTTSGQSVTAGDISEEP
jgi:hypothetical protein